MGSPSADMKAGGLNPLLEELLRQRRIQQAPMPPAQDPRYNQTPQQPMPPVSPFQGGNIPGINGQPMPYPAHPMPQGGMIRGGGMRVDPWIWSDTPGIGHQSNWMDQMRNKLPKDQPGGQSLSDMLLRRQLLAHLQRQGINMNEMDLERLLTQQNEAQAVGTRQGMFDAQKALLRNQ